MLQLPRECRVFCAISPSNQWGWEEILANRANHLLDLLVWSKTTDSQKRTPQLRPKPFVPEFMKLPSKELAINKGSEARTVDEVRAILDRDRG